MIMTPRLRTLALAVHITLSVGWIGAVAGYIALDVAAATSRNAETLRACYLAMELIAWYVIVPLALASLLTGLVMALGTNWGLFRHYWVAISFGLTVFAVVILFVHMPTVSSTAAFAQTAEGIALEKLGGDVGHPGVGLVILLVVQ